MFDDEDFRGSRGGVRNDLKHRAINNRVSFRLNGSLGGFSNRGSTKEGSLAGRGQGSGAEQTFGAGHGPSREVVFKIIGHIKSARGVDAATRYISGNRDDKDRETNEEIAENLPLTNQDRTTIPVWTEDGRRLEGEDILKEIESWELIPDRDNIKSSIKSMSRQEQKEMPSSQRLAKRQASHVIFSMPRHTGMNKQKEVTQAVGSTLNQAIGSQGHRYIYSTHNHEGKVHVHAIIKARSETLSPAMNTRQLRINRSDIDAIRSTFAEELQRRGIDRAQLREKIRAGEEPLKKNEKYNRVRAVSKWFEELERRVPKWHKRHGLNYLSNLNGHERPIDDDQRSVASERWQRLSAHGAAGRRQSTELLELFSKRYSDPTMALESFNGLYDEDKRLAAWSLEKRPETFGQVVDDAVKAPNRASLHKAMVGLETEQVFEPAYEQSDRYRASVRHEIEAEKRGYRENKADRDVTHAGRSANGSTDSLVIDFACLNEKTAKVPEELYHGADYGADRPAPGRQGLIWASSDAQAAHRRGEEALRVQFDLRNPFDGGNPNHRGMIKSELQRLEPGRADQLLDQIKETGNSDTLENSSVLEAIKRSNFDGLIARESIDGQDQEILNVAAFTDDQVRVIDRDRTFGQDPDRSQADPEREAGVTAQITAEPGLKSQDQSLADKIDAAREAFEKAAEFMNRGLGQGRERS